MDYILGLLANPTAWVALATLVTMEVVLGIDNLIFIAILTDRLPDKSRARTRNIGLLLAGGIRVLLLLVISQMMKFTAELFAVFGHSVSGKDLVLIGGGLFLIAKATHEIHARLEADASPHAPKHVAQTAAMVLLQILALDVVFSLDSIITAVGMARSLAVMIIAILASVGVMMWFAGPVGAFVRRHPTMRMLALSFLVLIGVMLVAEGCGKHIEKGYIYFAMAFSFVVELLNLRSRRLRPQPQPANSEP